MSNQLIHAPWSYLVRPIFYTRKCFSCKLSMHKSTHTPSLLMHKWIGMSWFCIWIQIWFEFKCATTYLYPLMRIRHVRCCFKKGRKVGRAKKFLERKFGVWGTFLYEVKVQNLPREKERKERKKGAEFFLVYPRVSAWGSGSEKVNYECRELTKF